jgi:hypothetical protein
MNYSLKMLENFFFMLNNFINTQKLHDIASV